MRFGTKIGIVVRDDLAVWQKLNVTAFLAGGVAGGVPETVGERYADASGNGYLPMIRQPVLVYAADAAGLAWARERAVARGLDTAVYIEEMFKTGNDADNRAAVRAVTAEEMNLVGLAVHDPRNAVDKVLKGLPLHPWPRCRGRRDRPSPSGDRERAPGGAVPYGTGSRTARVVRRLGRQREGAVQAGDAQQPGQERAGRGEGDGGVERPGVVPDADEDAQPERVAERHVRQVQDERARPVLVQGVQQALAQRRAGGDVDLAGQPDGDDVRGGR